MLRRGGAASLTRLGLSVGAAAALVASLAAPVVAGSPSSSTSGAFQGILYYTRFQYPPSGANVKSVAFSYDGSTFSVNTAAIASVASVPAADGIAFAPSGDLLVGGQFTGNVYDINPTSGAYSTVAVGTPATFMLGLSPDGNTAYVGSVGDGANDEIGVLNLATTPPTAEAPIKVSGPDSNVDSIAFDQGQAYYTSSLPGQSGDFGSIDLSTGVETRLLTDVPYAHGMTYDSFTGDLVLAGTGGGVSQIAQIKPSPTSATVVSTRTVTLPAGGDPSNSYYATLDLPWADGQGHIFVAANDGYLTFVDESQTGLLGDGSDFATTVYVDSYLDDVVGALAQTPGPQFVIWGANRSDNQQIQLGGDYNFWGHSWWKQINISNPGGTVPNGVARFKGFADQGAYCGEPWTAAPGNSSNPPEIMGNYVSVIVTTNMFKNGPTTGGNIQEIVILKVDNPGAYKDDPGHVMTGTMVGIVCQA